MFPLDTNKKFNRFKIWLCVIGLIILWVCGGCESEMSIKTPATEPPTQKTKERPLPLKEGNVYDGKTIKIGLVTSLTGELAPWGIDVLKGAQLAFEEANRHSKKHIELLVEDCASKPEQAKTAAERLIAKGVLGIIGEMSSGINMQVANAAYESGVPLLACGAGRIELTHVASNVFRCCFTTDFQGQSMAVFAYNELGLRKAAVLTDRKQPYSTSVSRAFKEKFKRLGGRIVSEQFYESGHACFTGQLTKIKHLNPDLLFLSGYYTEVGLIARQAKGLNIHATLMGTDGWDSTLLQSYGGQAIVGAYHINHYSDDENQTLVNEFKQKWFGKHQTTNTTCAQALSYDAGKLMLTAIEKYSVTNSNGLMHALEQSSKYKGVTGEITLRSRQGDPDKGGVIVQVTKKGTKFAKRYKYNEIVK